MGPGPGLRNRETPSPRPSPGLGAAKSQARQSYAAVAGCSCQEAGTGWRESPRCTCPPRPRLLSWVLGGGEVGPGPHDSFLTSAPTPVSRHLQLAASSQGCLAWLLAIPGTGSGRRNPLRCSDPTLPTQAQPSNTGDPCDTEALFRNPHPAMQRGIRAFSVFSP